MNEFWEPWYTGETLPGYETYIRLHRKSSARMWIHETNVSMGQNNGGWSSWQAPYATKEVFSFMLPVWIVLAFIVGRFIKWAESP